MVYRRKALKLTKVMFTVFILQFLLWGGNSTMKIQKKIHGKLKDGRIAHIFSLKNKNGIIVEISEYGGIITKWIVPDKKGKFADIVLGYESLGKYINDSPYFGAIVGRYANRINRGIFFIDGKKYQLTINDGKNHLHGGKKGFDKVLWKGKKIKKDNGIGVELSYLSKDGEEGYPGNLKVKVFYFLDNNNSLTISFEAETDKPTPVNLSNHSYFNLKGAGNGDILDHILTINADKYTEVNKELIPTGKLLPVENTPFDFRTPHRIGERIAKVKGGYDHNFVLNKKKENELSFAVKLEEPSSGRILEIYTTQPGIQFYSGNFLDGSIIGKGGKRYYKHYALCLEPQHFPDSPNHPNFPNTILRPGEKYSQKIIYKFLVKR